MTIGIINTEHLLHAVRIVMAKYHIIVDDTTTAGAQLIRTAQKFAQSYQAAAEISQLDKPLTGTTKSIDDGLKLIIQSKPKTFSRGVAMAVVTVKRKPTNQIII